MKWNDFSKVLKGDHRDIFINLLDSTQPGGEVEDLNPLVLSEKANSEDNPRYHEAMNGPDAEDFQEAMHIAYDQLQKKKAWIIVEKKKEYNVLGSTWVYKVERYPDGRVKKLKARLCICVDQQIEGVDYFKTYAPVVQWSTIMTMLILSVALNWKFKQVDYELACLHAALEDDVYVDMPRGFQQPRRVMKLLKSFY